MSNIDFIHDPRLKNIAPEKIQFLTQIVSGFNEISEEERLPYFMAILGSEKMHMLRESPEDTQLILTVLKESLSDTDSMRHKINALLSMF